MMKLIIAWHRFVVKHFVAGNIILLIGALFCLFNLKNLSFDGDWLNLFSPTDHVYKDYQELVAEEGSRSSIFIKLSNVPKSRLDTLVKEIRQIDGVYYAKPMDLDASPKPQWLEVSVEADPGFYSTRTDGPIKSIAYYLDDSHAEYGITGAMPILEEFTRSVKADFIKTSFIALALIVFIIIFFFRFSPSVIFGFLYQGVGLIAAMFIFKRIYGEMNSLAAMLPCVLIGIGVDFVIHSIVAADSSSDKCTCLSGEMIYRKVSVPIFWGALTTALAFLSLLLARLKGLHQAGVLGALSVMFMFLFVILFLPAAVSYFNDRGSGRKIRSNMHIPLVNSKKPAVALLIIAVCILPVFFTGRVKFEERIENLYNKDMVSLSLQDELSGKLGVYPSKLYVSFETGDPKKSIQRLKQASETFIPDPETLKILPLRRGSGRSKVTMQVFPRKNPFAPKAYENLKLQFAKIFDREVESALLISGDAVLYHHMNDLLIKGMAMAFFAVFIFLSLVLIILFKNVRFVLSALGVLFAATVVTLGGFGLFSISLSAYTITLFPLFIGIGVDDCLHVAYLKKKGLRLASDTSVLKAITLTTITTVLCYGSLIAAKNAGFSSAGKAAVLGLGLMFIFSVYLLPVLLELNFSKKGRMAA